MAGSLTLIASNFLSFLSRLTRHTYIPHTQFWWQLIFNTLYVCAQAFWINASIVSSDMPSCDSLTVCNVHTSEPLERNLLFLHLFVFIGHLVWLIVNENCLQLNEMDRETGKIPVRYCSIEIQHYDCVDSLSNHCEMFYFLVWANSQTATCFAGRTTIIAQNR